MTQIAKPTSLTTDEWDGAYTDLADSADSTYIESPVLPVEAQTFTCALAEVSEPPVDTGHQIRVRAYAYPSLATAHDLVLKLENSDDGSTVAEWTYSTVPDALEDEVLTLTEAEAAQIHSYAGLRVKGRGKRQTGTEIAFVWDDVTNATSYVLQVGTATGQSDRCNSNVGNVTTMALTLAPGTYYSRVVIVGGEHDGELTPGGEKSVTVT